MRSGRNGGGCRPAVLVSAVLVASALCVACSSDDGPVSQRTSTTTRGSTPTTTQPVGPTTTDPCDPVRPEAPFVPSDPAYAVPDTAQGAKLLGPLPHSTMSTSIVWFRHPTWGPVRMVVFLDPPRPECGQPNIVVIDASNTVRYRWRGERSFLRDLQPVGISFPTSSSDVPGPIDATGNIFLTGNAGKSDEVSVLRPTPTGFDDFDTLGGAGGPFETRPGVALDVDHDGTYELLSEGYTDCVPTCATGHIGPDTLYRWNGSTYVVARTGPHPLPPHEP